MQYELRSFIEYSLGTHPYRNSETPTLVLTVHIQNGGHRRHHE